MESEIIVLSANAWSLTDESGKNLTGVTIWYLPAKDMSPVINSDTSYGVQPCKSTVDTSILDSIKKLGGCPLQCKGKFVMKVSGGKQVLALSDISK